MFQVCCIPVFFIHQDHFSIQEKSMRIVHFAPSGTSLPLYSKIILSGNIGAAVSEIH